MGVNTMRRTQTVTVCERVMNRMLGLTLEETTAGWRKINNEVSCNVYCSLTAITVIKSRKMRWVAIVARNGQVSENLNGRSHFRDIGENGSVIFKWIFTKQDDSVG